MPKIKTTALTGPALDFAVSVAKGIPVEEIYISGKSPYISIFRRNRDEEGNLNGCYTTGPDLLFSTKWEAGGPIIQQEMMRIISPLEKGVDWVARIKITPIKGDFLGWHEARGATPLIAAMRCYVFSKLGEVAEIPNELIARMKG